MNPEIDSALRNGIYDSMPAEQRLRELCSSGGASSSDLLKLVEISIRRHRHWDVLRLGLSMIRLRSMRQAPWREMARANRSLAQGARARRQARGRPLRFAFLYQLPHFREVARSVIDAAKERHIVGEIERTEDVVAFEPDVVLSPQANPYDVWTLRQKTPQALFVYLRHGVAAKTNAIVTATYYDAVCVSSPWVARYYIKRGMLARRTLWVTGYPQMDAIMRPGKASLRQLSTFLYAPTHNPGLTSVGWLTPDRMIGFINANPDVKLIVKLHPNLWYSPAWAEWRSACSNHGRIEFSDDPMIGIDAYLHRADLVLSDFSSAWLLFLPFDRPIVLLTPPSALGAKNLDPHAIEYQWRDACLEVADLDTLDETLRAALTSPASLGEKRRIYAKLLFGNTLDGRCGHRVVRRIETLFG